MRIAVVDYSGHAFAVQLSRALAARGHEVRHFHFSEFQSPHGTLSRTAEDPDNFSIQPISLGVPFYKYSFVRRRFQEVRIGRAFAAAITAFGADVVLAGNCPLDCVAEIGRSARRAGSRFVFWQQDIYSAAIARILSRKFGLPGRLVGAHYRRVERNALRASDAIVVISRDFVDTIRHELQLPAERIHVIENWAPIRELPLRPKDNDWARRHGLADKIVVLYSGTIGLKHDPHQLLDLALSLQSDATAMMMVVSEGPYADWLASQCAQLGLANVRVLPFQPFEDFPDVLGSADVTVAILEPDAGVFSVPSKILSYLCAGRAIVLSAPSENLAARIVRGFDAGRVVDAGDRAALVHAVRLFLDNPALRTEAGRNARRHAEATFDIEMVATRFEAVFRDVLSERQRARVPGALPDDTVRPTVRP
ncbi:glycosyltransferase family 4 protein [Bradyrhizobium sp. 2TAF24]|uniref:glycosyltransferase family 4 protein n=1 Tax=Bradyrhizobium sp. 2TAF24 TaxID=3233011 RepID=UPI003F8E92F0